MELNENTFFYCFLMTPKTLKYVNLEKQDNFSRKHENTLKSMEFYKRDEYFCPPSVIPYFKQRIVTGIDVPLLVFQVIVLFISVCFTHMIEL